MILTHYLMIDQLSATADCHHQMTLEASLGLAQWPTIVAPCIWSVRCNLEVHGLFCCRLSLDLWNPWFPVSFSDTLSSNDAVDTNSHGGPVAVHRIVVSLEKWAGGTIDPSLISAHFSISAYFLTTQTYKRMRFTTRVYGIFTDTSVLAS